MRVRFTPPDELSLAGSWQELCELRDEVEAAAIAAEPTRVVRRLARDAAAPYQRCLAGLRLGITGGPVRVRVVDDWLVIEGGGESMSVFASFLDFAPDSGPGSHHHHDAEGGDRHVASDSLPLVVELE